MQCKAINILNSCDSLLKQAQIRNNLIDSNRNQEQVHHTMEENTSKEDMEGK